MAYIKVSGGWKKLDEISDPDVQIINADFYNSWPPSGDIKLFWASNNYPEADQADCLKKFPLAKGAGQSGSEEQQAAEYCEALKAFHDWAEELNQVPVSSEPRLLRIESWNCFTKPRHYDVYLDIEKIGRIESPGNNEKNCREIVEICSGLCSLLMRFYKLTKRPHCNINHLNLFRVMGNRTALGNCSLSGWKNDLPYYTAPEIRLGKVADESADVYCLGMWLYEMLRAGEQHLFQADIDLAGIDAGQIVLQPCVPKEMQDMIVKALKKDPADRYKNPEQMRCALERIYRIRNPIPLKKLGVIAASIALVGALLYFASGYDPGAGKIQGKIEAKNYSLAYVAITERSGGKATDRLIIQYINGCLDSFDYQRAAEIIPEFSQDMFDNPEYLEKVMKVYVDKKKMNVLEPVLDNVYGRSAETAALIDRIRANG